jgi:hypothetical protein
LTGADNGLNLRGVDTLLKAILPELRGAKTEMTIEKFEIFRLFSNEPAGRRA